MRWRRRIATALAGAAGDRQPKRGAQRVSDRDVLKNARLAASEVRAQVDHQIAAARDIDTKLMALISVISGAAGLVTARLHLDTPERIVASIVSAVFALFALGMSFQGLRAGGTTSFGVDPNALTSVLEDFDEAAIALAVADGLARSRERNRTALASKWRFLDLALLGIFLTLLSLGALINVGAVQ